MDGKTSQDQVLAGECIICKCGNASKPGKTCKLSVDGLVKLYDCAVSKQLSDLVDLIDANKDKPLYVHNNCRIKVTRQDIKSTMQSDDLQQNPLKRKMRSACDGFNWRGMCFLCAETIDKNDAGVHCVRTFLPNRKMEEVIAERGAQDGL